MSEFSLVDLEKIVARRASAAPEDSWTAKLVAGGQRKAAQKLGEEAVEAAIAAVTNDNESLTAESADLLYHLLVVLNIAGVSLNDVMAELQQRTARTGLQEKANRAKP